MSNGFERNEVSNKAQGGTEIMRDMIESRLDKDLLQDFQIILSRPRELKENKIRVFSAHDLPEDPECAKFKDQTFLASFHKFVFISVWQMQRYQLIHNIPHDNKSIVLETGIRPAPVECLTKPKDKIRLVYTSTPQRGLEILVPVFEHLAKTNPNIHLDVFSSFKIYGQDQRDALYEPLYNRIRNHPQMTYHGFTPNDKLKEHLNTAHIFAYPSTWIETSCRAMLEAMSAGLVCVHPNNGALNESSGSLNIMYQYLDNPNEHANAFAAYLQSAIDSVTNNYEVPMITFNKTYVDSRYNIDFIASKWESMLKQLMKKYPSAESRALPKAPVFVYDTEKK